MVDKRRDYRVVCFPFFFINGELWKCNIEENCWENLTLKEDHNMSPHQINKEYLERISSEYLDKNKDDINKEEVL